MTSDANTDSQLTDNQIDISKFFVEDYQKILELSLISPHKVDEIIEKAGLNQIKSTEILLNNSATGIAVLDQSGKMISCTDEFDKDGSEKRIDPELGQQALLRAKAVFDPIASMLYVPTAMLGIWAWPHPLAQAISVPDSVAVFTERLNQHDVILKACISLGLRDIHCRIIVATIDHGTIKAAAHQLDISHQRARAIVSEALAVTQRSNIQELITLISEQNLGIIANNHAAVDELLCKIWAVTERQARLAILISQGYSRSVAAKFLGLSQAVVKKEMSALYQGLGIKSAPELAARVAVARLFAGFKLSKKISGEINNLSEESLQIIFSSGGRRIAYSDYGPKNGFPVFFIHSSMTSRAVPRTIRNALIDRGFRIISIDRPGFGLTAKADWNQFEQAAKDFCLIQDRTHTKPALALSRGGAQFLLALARHRPDALLAAVVVNPDPVSAFSKKREGPLGAVKEYFLQSPLMISAFAAITGKILTPKLMNYWLKKSLSSSEADSKALLNNEIVEDYWESIKSFSVGLTDGYVAEQIEIATNFDKYNNESAWHWNFIIGLQDALHDPNEAAEYWKKLIPSSNVKIVHDGGRLLAFTHAKEISETLLSIQADKLKSV